MHVYSIDEAFLDVTDYLKLYNTDDVTLAKRIMEKITNQTGLTGTCGIGPNLLLAKIALDTVYYKLYNLCIVLDLCYRIFLWFQVYLFLCYCYLFR